MTENRDIDSRLTNWSRWNTATMGPRVSASNTGAICEAMRRAVEGSQDNSQERRKIDDNDALLIERNLWKLRGTQRTLLRMHYVNGWRWPLILRMIGHPVSKLRFESLLKNAQEAIECAIDKNERVTG